MAKDAPTETQEITAADVANLPGVPGSNKELVRAMRKDMRRRMEVAGNYATSEENADAIMARIASDIGAAETVEDVLDSGKTTPVSGERGGINPDLQGRRLRILAWQARYSTDIVTKDNEPAPFAVIFAVDPETGEELTLSCGGEIVLAQLTKIQELGKFPQDIEFEERGRAIRMVAASRVVIDVEGTS